MDQLRKPLFCLGLGAVVLTYLMETGSPWLVGGGRVSSDDSKRMREAVGGALNDPGFGAAGLSEVERARLADSLGGRGEAPEKPPGLAISALARLDGLMAALVGLIGVSLVVPERLHVKYQAVVMLIAALAILLLSLKDIFATLVELTVMVGLFTAAPFGTVVYLAKWGFFDRAGATAILGTVMMLKLAFGACLVAAHPRFLQNKGLVLLVLTTLVANLLVGFLHGYVPIFLVSIADAIAAIVIGIVAAIWAAVVLVGAAISVVKLIL